MLVPSLATSVGTFHSLLMPCILSPKEGNHNTPTPHITKQLLELERGVSILELWNKLLTDICCNLTCHFNQNFPHAVLKTGVHDLLRLHQYPAMFDER
jgi:hypothetical protein